MESARAKTTPPADRTAAYADMFAALGAEPRLRILRALLAAHPDGMVVGDIQSELGIAASTLSHHLEKLKNEDLITVRRESTFLATPPIRPLWSSCSASCTPNVAPGTKHETGQITQICR